MVPLLLLLLLPNSMADQGTVCLDISESKISITTTHANISEDWTDNVKCEMNDFGPCLILCTFNNATWRNGSNMCFEADVTSLSHGNIVYNIQNNVSCNLFLCNETHILRLIHSLHSDSSDKREMMQLFYIRNSCISLFSTNHEVKTAFINVERQIIHNIMGSSLLEDGRSTNSSLKFLSLNVLNISEAYLDATGTKDWIHTEAPQLLPQNKSFIPDIWLPIDALRSIPKEKRIIGLISYMHHSQFQFEHEEIPSMVLRIELPGGHHLYNLKTSVKMIFRVDAHRNMDNKTRLQCHYFDEQEWHWKTDGCETTTLNNSNDIICNCDHTTPFAVLLIREPIAEIHWRILSYISYMGCGLSAFFTALSLVLYVFSRNHRQDYSICIHVSLSGALFLLNSTFLLTEWGATVELDWVCVLVAALMHYSLLCSFTWMAIEALHLYLLLIKVFNTYYKHYMVKLSLAGWGIPGVIVAISLGMKDFKQFYGITQMTMADTNQTNAICWITDDSFFYSLNLVYFTLIFIFNSGILMTVASSICKIKQVYRGDLKHQSNTGEDSWNYPEKFGATCRSGVTVLGLTCLMGTTWGLAFLGSGYVNYAILYLFCIFNSIQGFFIFLWICQSVRKQRRRYIEDKMTSSPVRVTGTKAD
ncbi:Adhesion G-protein coupled receptor G6 G-protein coupled receptor 126 [Channa argus]|uniref:Adhesion G-protein coupled receptor G6 G-protein coupled receptor 126 n=1 Tax=Channa argus TaxID=215402 RepID=A0A6G1PA87_CHAAH|nr:Adhesion G-protein coupled receptor G6 G-protein coupled receptor 126 [Channa argus]